ncbi:MAG TPA: hypothetical protein VLS45_05185, partial [Methylomicrobium sp.]|nr:hypothetical protein [Methylomicrobium sp.]
MTNKNTEGNAETTYIQKKRERAAVQVESALSARIQYAAALYYREELLLYGRHPEMTFMQFSEK